MQSLLTILKQWGPPAFSTALMAAAVSFTWSRSTSTEDTIRRVDSLGSSLSDMATTAGHAVLTPEEYSALDDHEREALARRAESGKSALIAAQLTETVRKVGARFIGSEPIVESGGRAGKSDGPRHPRHRVTVEGTFRQLAEFMDVCAAQRLPLRVTDFGMTRTEQDLKSQISNQDDGAAVLRAVITLESFSRAESKEPTGSAMS